MKRFVVAVFALGLSMGPAASASTFSFKDMIGKWLDDQQNEFVLYEKSFTHQIWTPYLGLSVIAMSGGVGGSDIKVYNGQGEACYFFVFINQNDDPRTMVWSRRDVGEIRHACPRLLKFREEK